MAARVVACCDLVRGSEGGGSLRVAKGVADMALGLYRGRAWHGRPHMDRRSIGVRSDTEPKEEEDTAGVRASLVSETEREEGCCRSGLP